MLCALAGAINTIAHCWSTAASHRHVQDICLVVACHKQDQHQQALPAAAHYMADPFAGQNVQRSYLRGLKQSPAAMLQAQGLHSSIRWLNIHVQPSGLVISRTAASRARCRKAHITPGSSSFNACMQLLAHEAAQIAQSSGSFPTPQAPADMVAYLREHEQDHEHARPEGDHWLLLQCGNWQDHPHRWAGPAYSLLQLWPVDDQWCDYYLWELDPSCMPTGKLYWSMTGDSSVGVRGTINSLVFAACLGVATPHRGFFSMDLAVCAFRLPADTHLPDCTLFACLFAEMELQTDRAGRRKYVSSCSVVGVPSNSTAPGGRCWGSLRNWLDRQFGEDTKL